MGFLNWLGLIAPGKKLGLGDPAPDLVGQDESGNQVRLIEQCREAYTLVYFFPKADTPGCTAQACALRDEFTVLTSRKVHVVGVSSDSADALRSFKEKRHLPFPLLTDENHKLSEGFGVPTLLGMTHRQSFLFKDGKLVWRDLKASTRWQARDVLEAVNRLEVSKVS